MQSKNFQPFEAYALDTPRDMAGVNGYDRPSWHSRHYYTPQAIMNGPGANGEIGIFVHFDSYSRAGGNLFGLGHPSSGPSIYGFLNAPGNEIQISVRGTDGVQTISSHQVPAFNRSQYMFWYIKPWANVCWFMANGRSRTGPGVPDPMTGAKTMGPMYANGVTLLNRQHPLSGLSRTVTWDLSANTGSIGSAPELQTGDIVDITGGTLPTPLVGGTSYFLIRISDGVYQFADTLANAVAGTAIDLGGAPSGTQTLQHRQSGIPNAMNGGIYDFGLFYLPQNALTDAEIEAASLDLCDTGSSLILPWDYTGNGYCRARFTPDAADAVAGTARNRVTAITPAGSQHVLIPGTQTSVNGGVKLTHRVGYEFANISTINANQICYLKVPSHEMFDFVDSDEGAIWETFHNPDVLPANGTGQSLMGDLNNFVEEYNDAGVRKLRLRVDAPGTPVNVLSPATHALTQDQWVAGMYVNNGQATNNIMVGAHGKLSAGSTRAADSLAAVTDFNGGANNNPPIDTPATGQLPIYAPCAFFRVWKIKKAYFPTNAELALICDHHSRSFEPGNGPGVPHPLLLELLAKRVAGAVVARMVEYVPGNIRRTGTSPETWTWDARTVNVTSPSALNGTIPYSQIAFIAQRSTRTRRVIHVKGGGTTPTIQACRGLPSGLGNGLAAGPYRGAGCLGIALTNVSGAGNGHPIAGDEIRYQAYDYSAEGDLAAVVAGVNGFRSRLVGLRSALLEPGVTSSLIKKFTRNLANFDVIGGVFTNTTASGDGLADGASAAKCRTSGAIANECLGDGADVATGATDIIYDGNLFLNNGGQGIRSDVVIEVNNNATKGNAGSITSAVGTITNNNNWGEGAPTTMSAGATDIVGTPIKLVDETATPPNMEQTKWSIGIATGQGAKSVGPFQFFGKEGKRLGNRAEVKGLGEIELR